MTHLQPGAPLLSCVMQDRCRTAPRPTLAEIREHAAAQLAALPSLLRGLEPAPTYPVTVSERLRELARLVDARTGN